MPTTEVNPAATLALPYGKQTTQGQVLYYEKQGDRTAFIVLFGKSGCDGLDLARVKGADLAEFDAAGDRQWKFHSGEGVTDYPDAFFSHLNWNGAGRSFAELKLPAVLSDEGEPSEAQFWLRGLKSRDYDATGAALSGGARTYARSNARIVADLWVERAARYWARRGVDPKTLIEWASWVEFRQECDAAIGWETGFGIKGEYFQNADLTGLAVTRTDARVDFDWGESAPALEVTPNTYSVRWTGKVKPRYSQSYTFHVTADDGMRLWVNGVQLVNEWTTGAARERSGAIALAADQEYPVVLEYFQQTGSASVRLEWSSASQAREVVPQERLIAGSRQVTRYTGDVVIAETTPLAEAVRQVMLKCPGVGMQFAGGKWRFLPSPSRPVTHRLTFDVTQTASRPNVADGFQAYRRHPKEKPREVIVNYRDEDDLYLKPRKVRIKRPNYVGRPLEINVGVASQSLASRVGESVARRFDLDLFYRVTAFPSSYRLAQHDVAEVSNSVYGWLESAPMEFMVLSDKLRRDDTHELFLQIYSEEFYSDDDHGQIEAPSTSTLPNPFTKPPRVASVVTAQGAAVGPDGLFTVVVGGQVAFSEHAYRQRGRVWLKLEGASDFTPLDDRLVELAPGGLVGAFTLFNVPEGDHEVKVVSESLAGVTRGAADAVAYPFSVEIPAEPSPTGAALVENDDTHDVQMEWDGSPVTAARTSRSTSWRFGTRPRPR